MIVTDCRWLLFYDNTADHYEVIWEVLDNYVVITIEEKTIMEDALMDAIEETKEREQLEKVKYITERIMDVAYARAREILRKKNGWICGTFNSAIRRNVERELLSTFDELEMDYIFEHLPPENEGDTCFDIADDNQLRRFLRNDLLNSIVPGLHIHYYHDFLK